MAEIDEEKVKDMLVFLLNRMTDEQLAETADVVECLVNGELK